MLLSPVSKKLLISLFLYVCVLWFHYFEVIRHFWSVLFPYLSPLNETLCYVCLPGRKGNTAWGFLAFFHFFKGMDISLGSSSPAGYPEAQGGGDSSQNWKFSEFHIPPSIQKTGKALGRRLEVALRHETNPGNVVLSVRKEARTGKQNLICAQYRWLAMWGLWNFKPAILNMFKDLKETTSKELKESLRTMSHQIESMKI